MRGVPEDVMVVDEDLFAGDFVTHRQTARFGKVLWIGRRGHMVVEFHQWGEGYAGYVEEWKWVSDFVKAQLWICPALVPPERRMRSSGWRWLSEPYPGGGCSR